MIAEIVLHMSCVPLVLPVDLDRVITLADVAFSVMLNPNYQTLNVEPRYQAVHGCRLSAYLWRRSQTNSLDPPL